MVQLSVIVAGGTGSTGREIVSKLVAHPKVSRVVVLSRYPIPVNRWQTFFPNIRTADALKHLSIVAVDWQRLHNDSMRIPISKLSGEEQISSPDLTPSNVADDSAKRPLADEGDHSKESKKKSSLLTRSLQWASYDSILGSASSFSSSQVSSYLSSSLPSQGELLSASSGGDDHLKRQITDERFVKKRLHELLQSAFYRSVFSGHNVAINCLGSHNVLSPRSVEAVDHDYALAFAKLVRIFNCYSEEDDVAQSLGEELDALKESAMATATDDTAWNEILAAYFGLEGAEMGTRFPDRRDLLEMLQREATQRKPDVEEETLVGNVPAASSKAPPSSFAMPPRKRASLLQYTQLSTAGASPLSPLPYFKAHGLCDEEVLQLFDRSSNQKSAAARTEGRSEGASSEDDHVTSDEASQTQGRQASKYPRRYATLKNNAHLTIWKPSLIKRPNARLIEKLLALVAPPISVEDLSGMIVDDVIQSVSDERDEDEMGTLKIVGAKHVAVWAKLRRQGKQ